MSIGSRLVLLMALAGSAAPAAAATAAPSDVRVAPGRVTFAVDVAGTQSNVDAGGAAHAVALPDGGALLFGATKAGGATLYGVKIDRRGAIDRSLGAGGAVAIARPAPFDVVQILRQRDGRILLVGSAPQTQPATAPPPLTVTRLNADLSLDRSFGSGGTATAPIGEGCAACTTAALAADGSIVLVGAAGRYNTPPTGPDLRWALTRLTPAGAVDASFGTGGVATIATGASTSGFNVAFGPGGSIVTEAQSSSGLLAGRAQLHLARLTAAGRPDPSFAGGAPVALPFATGFYLVVLADGSVVVNGQPASSQPLPTQPSRQLLARYTPSGAFAGLVDLGTASDPRQLLPAADGAVDVVGTPAYALIPSTVPRPGQLDVRRVGADGAITPLATVTLPFGGGGSSFVVSRRPRPVPSLLQNSFTGATLLPRPDGSYLVAGAVAVRQPTGEGEGISLGRFAAASLTPAFAADETFGGSAPPLRVAVRLLRQRAATARTRHGIRIELEASAVGLARVKVRHGERAIAHSLLPVFTTARHVIPVELTAYGNRYLRRHHNVRVSITATARDLVTTTATASARGRLR